jgi:hypothetical protein
MAGRKAFFFEKKKQKTFNHHARVRRVRDSHPKVFWFFFSKKNIRPSLTAPAYAAPPWTRCRP